MAFESNPVLKKKYEELLEYLRSLGSVVVGFSSGVDSALLVYVAKEALGNQMLAVTAKAMQFPKREFLEAEAFCKTYDIPQAILSVNAEEIDGFLENPRNRCYLCKKVLFGKICCFARERGFAYVADGSNVDDEGDYRPGLLAVKELLVVSPFRHCKMTKKDIREMSRELQLPTANKASFACLASRVPYQEPITAEKLRMVELAEEELMALGFEQFRVRIHGNLARIELLPKDLPRMLAEEAREQLYKRFLEIGFQYVSLDLLGYRMGSMNEALSTEEKALGINGQ